MAKGVIFDIQRFSVNDGPGIRTTVFLKGCPLACRWCHNPEGRDGRIQMRFFAAKCLDCGRCVAITGVRPSSLSGKSVGEKEAEAAAHCPSRALEICGKVYTPEQIVDVIERDRDFYDAQGGVTFSGGEATVWSDFLEETLLLCHERGIHTTLDTCGYAPREVYERILPLCDLVLFDIKGMQPDAHRQYIGKDNTLILDNFRYTAKSGTPIWVRIPLIYGFTADMEELKSIAEFLMPYQQAIQKITLMPYHSFGNAKYVTVGLEPEHFPELEDETVHEYEGLFAQYGFMVGR